MLGFVVWTFAETALGVAGENLAALSRIRLARHHRSALVALLLFLPIGILLPSIWLDIAVVRDLLTVDGDRPTALGLTLILGGLVLLPVAFVVALLPMMRRGPQPEAEGVCRERARLRGHLDPDGRDALRIRRGDLSMRDPGDSELRLTLAVLP